MLRRLSHLLVRIAGPWLYWLRVNLCAGFAVLGMLNSYTWKAVAAPAITVHEGNGHAVLEHTDAHATPNGIHHSKHSSKPSVANCQQPSKHMILQTGKQNLLSYVQQHYTAICLSLMTFALLPDNTIPQTPVWGSAVNQSVADIWQQEAMVAGQTLLTAASVVLVFHTGMIVLPSCFSIGEGVLLAACVASTMAAAMQLTPLLPVFIPRSLISVFGPTTQQHVTQLVESLQQSHCPGYVQLSVFIVLLIASMVALCWIMWAALCYSTSSKAPAAASAASVKPSYSPAITHGISQLPSALMLSTAVVPVTVIGILALWTLLEFVPLNPSRFWVLGYWAAVLAVTLPLMRLAARHTKVPQVSWLTSSLGYG